MNNAYLERLYNMFLGFKNDKDLMKNIKEIKNLKDSIDKNMYVNTATFLYNNGNLSTTEKKEILNNIKGIYESLNVENSKSKGR